MIYILLSVCCSVIVSVMLKLARRYLIDVEQAITWNYLAAIGLTTIIYHPQLPALRAVPWNLYAPLGVLLPTIFLVMAVSVRHTGIVRTDIAQRLSLLLPLTASFLLFGETLSGVKSTGILLGFAAIVCLLPQKVASENRAPAYSWIFPLLVFAGIGIIDILFKQVALVTAFTSSLLVVYLIAFVVAGLYLLLKAFQGRLKFQWINFLCGVILGIFNFGNILFYLKAHQAVSTRPSLVFSGMNIGVIALGTIIGYGFFGEKLSLLNKVGILVAIAAILFIVKG